MNRTSGDKNLQRWQYVGWMTIVTTLSLLFFRLPIYAQQDTKSKPDSLKSNVRSTGLQDSSQKKVKLDTIPSKTIPIPLDSLGRYKDSTDIEDLLEDDKIIIPTPIDTINKIRLPVNLKKTKFAYFDASQSIDRVVPNRAFDIGEKLTFIIRYGVVVAGSSTMSIPEIKNINGNQAYKIITEAKSSAFFSTFYRVRDRVESYMDRDGLFTWRFEKHLREGKYHADQYVEYDQINGWAVTNKKDSMRIPPCVHDILSSFYYVRTQKLEVGKSIFIDNHAGNKLYPMEVMVHKKERIRVKAGEFDCIVVEPILRAAGLFKSKGRLLLWLTDDEKKIPVQMKSKIIIGYVTAELKEMKGIKK